MAKHLAPKCCHVLSTPEHTTVCDATPQCGGGSYVACAGNLPTCVEISHPSTSPYSPPTCAQGSFVQCQ
ncbi:uncharacterized protein MELLADRAFT_57404 [Melampsora larici-populina 98AG31]|uniref:Uncharacterized protein n=1 Tax=Melampsora larici-populina (strain 98AG31 / pathotype 3-4-7) TaxID=747676 RepID=F4S1W7_MELLP|nr:uncharacterized protein MELLADRAFT_57404 [Melampsora larici-populina 98AG31]EGG01369.1 hypothetical protein MELLADRAFT_57404 [Melampsora larici-populina 98AG31]